jgi:hypothetical protein
MDRPKEVIVAGYSKFPQNTSAEQLHSVLAMVVRVDTTTHLVTDASTTLVTAVAEKFIQELLIGRNLIQGSEDFVRQIQTRYFGHAQRGLIFAYRDLVNRYIAVLKEESDTDSAKTA